MTRLEETLSEWFEFIKNIENEQIQSLEEDNAKINELLSERDVLKNTHNSEKQILAHKESNLSKCEDNLKRLEEEKTKLLLEIETLEGRKKKLSLKTSGLNLKDQQLLDKGRKRFNLFKKITRIQWDYTDKENVKGYVTNNIDYIHAFCFKNEQNDGPVPDLVWKEIEQSCGLLQTDKECNKENRNRNK